MAIDDVISDYDNDVLTTATLSIQPASGDEWLTKALLFEGDAAWQLKGHTNSGVFQIGWPGGATAATTDPADQSGKSLSLLLTNSEYIRVTNSSGGTLNVGFSAIKTKD